MHFKNIVWELKEMKDGIGNMSRRNRTRSHIAPDQAGTLLVSDFQQGRWANLPPELLLDIIRRVEESETAWPARAAVVFCGSVCKSWRKITKEIVKAPEECGRLTFPASLKQPGTRDSPIQCFIRRDRANKTYFLYYGLVPSEDESDKFLLAARKVRRAASTDFVMSLAADDFSRASSTYIGKLRSNFLGTKFTIYDSNPPCDAAALSNCKTIRRFNSNRVSPKVPACHYRIGTIAYELNVLRSRGPRRMHCVMQSIPISCLKESSVVMPMSYPHSTGERDSPITIANGKEPIINISSTSLTDQEISTQGLADPLILKNKSPRWHEQLQCWCLNFKGRVTVASVKNFQLVAAVEPYHDIPAAEQEKVILQFGKIGKDIFTMDYRYPLSAFQAFAISLSSFDTKPACE